VVGTLASLAAGIPAGLAARAAMSVLGAAGGTSMMAAIGQLTVPGTARILIVPMVFGIPFACLLLWVGRRWSDRPWPIRMAAYAMGALIVPGLLFFTDAEFNLAGANSDLGRWLFVPSFLIYGAMVGVIGEGLLGRTGGGQSTASTSE
jgi:hypothetical protein